MNDYDFSDSEIRAFKNIMRDLFQEDPEKYEDNLTALTEDFCHDDRVNHDEWLDDSDHPCWDWAIEVSEEEEES